MRPFLDELVVDLKMDGGILADPGVDLLDSGSIAESL